jgi:uncharacterized protein YaiL (DUF2058 family)
LSRERSKNCQLGRIETVIHQERNTQTEQAAQSYAKQLFEQQGYRISKGKRGFDFVARRKGEVIPVEVKGRSDLNMNFTTMTKHELKTLLDVPNATVVLVYVNVKDEPQAIAHLALTKDDIDQSEVSNYRVRWKISLEKRIMDELRRKIETIQGLVKLQNPEPERRLT